MYYNVKIQHETFGDILNETFENPIQFKLFLKSIQGCIEMKEDLTFFNGQDFLIHIPHKHLVCSVIATNTKTYTVSDHLGVKSKIEALATKD